MHLISFGIFLLMWCLLFLISSLFSKIWRCLFCLIFWSMNKPRRYLSLFLVFHFILGFVVIFHLWLFTLLFIYCCLIFLSPWFSFCRFCLIISFCLCCHRTCLPVSKMNIYNSLIGTPFLLLLLVLNHRYFWLRLWFRCLQHIFFPLQLN